MIQLALAMALLPGLLQVRDFGKPDVGGDKNPAVKSPVDLAVDKAVKFLEKRYPRIVIHEPLNVELVLLALMHAKVRPDHPLIVQNFYKMMRQPMNQTYQTGLRGLVLEGLHRKNYQKQLTQLGLFFVQNQARNGQWDYSGTTRKMIPARYTTPALATLKLKKKRKPVPPGSTVVSTDPADVPAGTDVKLPPPPPKSRVPKQGGDNSNSQYAMMGLLAASRAAVVVPKETWERAEKFYESNQLDDGGWGYGKNGKKDNKSSGSMTAACLASLIVAKYYLDKKDFKKEPSVQRGLSRLSGMMNFAGNPGGAGKWQYYFIYGIEKVGSVAGLDRIGGRDWYKEGCDYLLSAQREDGSWRSIEDKGPTTVVTDTCFALLFLKRGTPRAEHPPKEPPPGKPGVDPNKRPAVSSGGTPKK